MKTAALLFILTTLPLATSAQPALSDYVFATGAIGVASQTIQLKATMGQPIVGITQGNTVHARLGFWTAAAEGTDVASEPVGGELPTRVVLHQNYPNPFNPVTTIRYSVPHAGPVRLAVYDMLGRERALLIGGVQAAGHHETTFKADVLPSGIYFYRLRAAGTVETRQLTLLK